MPIVSPDFFRHQELYISASLQAVVNGRLHDFTGRRYFYAELISDEDEGTEVFTTRNFAKNIGFGISDINIDISTSLQPIIEISFKDLYGNTMFGNNNSENIDYSVFFAWPPPKFKFTYKGYLGRQVTYMLSLKKYDVNFNSDDASYTIKGSFVPHQWGFFADLPFSFILAAKALKREEGELYTADSLAEKDPTKLLPEQRSVIDLIEIGTQVEISTASITSSFDEVISRLNSLYTNPSAYAADPGGFKPIKGQSNNETIDNFRILSLPDVTRAGNGFTPVTLEQLKKGSVNNINDFVYSKLLIFNPGDTNITDAARIEAAKGSYYSFSLAQIQDLEKQDTAIGRQKLSEIRDRAKDAIKENLKEIDKEISAIRFTENQEQLGKLTISQVLNQIASDSAYIMGRILQAGIKGFELHEDTRRTGVSDGSLIARHYPLVLNKEQEEVPAFDFSPNLTNADATAIGPTPSVSNIGIEDEGCEMDFVRKFTKAVIDGVIEYQNINSIDPATVESDVSSPLNVMEIFSPKPYNGLDFNKFSRDIVIRSAIAAWFTKSEDITNPKRIADANDIRALAEKDFKNITESDIRRLKLQGDDFFRLKDFCTFWVNLMNADGTGFLNGLGVVDTDEFDLEDFLKTNRDDVVAPEILNYRVILDRGSFGPEEIRTQAQIAEAEANAASSGSGFRSITVREICNALWSNGGGELASINRNTMAGDHFLHNGLPYFTSVYKAESDYHKFYIAFKGTDAIRAKAILDNQSLNSESVIYIESALNEDGDGLSDEVLAFNNLVATYQVLDYAKVRNSDDDRDVRSIIDSAFNDENTLDVFKNNLNEYKEQFLWNDKISLTENTDNQFILQDPILFVPAFSLNANAYKNIDEIVKDSIIDGLFDALEWAAITPASQVFIDILDSIDYVEPNERVAFDLWTGQRNTITNDGVEIDNDGADEGNFQRIFIRSICQQILTLIDKIEQEEQELTAQVVGTAQEGENVIYKQFHSLFQQWNSIIYNDGIDINGKITNSTSPGFEGLAVSLMREYGQGGVELNNEKITLTTRDSNFYQTALNSPNVGPRNGIFIYDFPLQRINQASNTDEANSSSAVIQVENSLISIEPLKEADSRTTVLNVIQNLCSKNNFMFIPVPGYAQYLDINDIYTPKAFLQETRILNFFHVMFIPTPESRALKPNKDDTYQSLTSLSDSQSNLSVDALEVKYGSTQNNVVKSINVSTQDNKVTAESVINLERLVNNENRNSRVTKDCSMLNVLAGRSYKASIDILGNAQVFPMQFFFIRNLPLFDGLYQILNVKHSITPNDMTTSIEGMRMRYASNDSYGSIHPVTIESLKELAASRQIDYLEPNKENAENQAGDVGQGESISTENVVELIVQDNIQNISDENISETEVVLGPASAGFINSIRLQTSNDNTTPIKNNIVKGNTITSQFMIRSMNLFIRDVFEPWAAWLKTNEPNLYKQVKITSAIRNTSPAGSSSTSRHFYGQAIDFRIPKNNKSEEQAENIKLFNSIMKWYRENPSKTYHTLLFETLSNDTVCWIHWGYDGNPNGVNSKMKRRYKDHSKVHTAAMNVNKDNSDITRASAGLL